MIVQTCHLSQGKPPLNPHFWRGYQESSSEYRRDRKEPLYEFDYEQIMSLLHSTMHSITPRLKSNRIQSLGGTNSTNVDTYCYHGYNNSKKGLPHSMIYLPNHVLIRGLRRT